MPGELVEPMKTRYARNNTAAHTSFDSGLAPTRENTYSALSDCQMRSRGDEPHQRHEKRDEKRTAQPLALVACARSAAMPMMTYATTTEASVVNNT